MTIQRNWQELIKPTKLEFVSGSDNARVASVVAEPLATPAERAAFAGEGPLILALPGSRRGEVSRLAPVLGEVLERVRAAHPQARVALPTVRGVADLVADLTADWPIRPQIITDPALKRGAFAAAERLNLDGLLALWHPSPVN